ncbi:MAG: hypothetical protein K8S16_13200 [Bacteroidales bacterium]|nr:hypothetical protein [Bacteroidales bacterium]
MDKIIENKIDFYELSIYREELRELKSQFFYIKRFLNKNTDLINFDLKEFNKSIGNKKHLFNNEISYPSEQNELLELLEKDYFLKIYYRDLIRKSILLIIFTKFENTLRMISTLAENENTSRIRIKDLNNSGGDIERYRKYLDKIIGVDFTKVNTNWSLIKEYNLIRNLIIHFDGIIDYYEEIKGQDKRRKLDGVIKRHNELEIYQKRLMLKDDIFLLNAIDTFIDFIRELALQLEVITEKKSFEITYIHYKDGSREKLKNEMMRK